MGVSGSALVLAVALAALAAWACSRLLVRLAAGRARLLDRTGGELRKVHAAPTPRIGGLAVATGLTAGILAAAGLGAEVDELLLLALCAAPGLVWGLIEDCSGRGDVLVRLALSAVAAAIGFVLLDARLTTLDVPLLDELLYFHPISFAFTLFAVTGVANAMNVIDGLNGLSGVNTLLASVGLALVAWTVGDPLVLTAASLLGASAAGFLAVNFPSGRLFLGDGGAYLVGLLLAVLSVVLVHRNTEVSPWFPLLLLAYPIWETLFSMYRRKRRGRSTGQADALHLHTLVYRRVVRWHGFNGGPRERAARNSLASACLWWLPTACLGFALAFWDDSPALQAAATLFAMCYVAAYRRIVRFGVPRGLVLRAPRRRANLLAARWRLDENAPSLAQGRPKGER
jgi:UDP-N-acetylmuramyl pentapeptide phosphotransferase/UDP-N-acetylglucosamine-1-phosphate transferase